MKIIKLVSSEVIGKTTKSWLDKTIEKIFIEPADSKLIEQVKYWYLEIDEENKKAHREIGFSEWNHPIIHLPQQNKPHGYWSDSQVLFVIDDYEEIESSEFEKFWKELK